MRNRFDRQLQVLNDELIEMGSLIEQAIEMACSALVRQDVEKAQKAILSLIHISEPTRRTPISYAVFCLKKKKRQKYRMPSSA